MAGEVQVQDRLSRALQCCGMGAGELLTLSDLILFHMGKGLHSSPTREGFRKDAVVPSVCAEQTRPRGGAEQPAQGHTAYKQWGWNAHTDLWNPGICGCCYTTEPLVSRVSEKPQKLIAHGLQAVHTATKSQSTGKLHHCSTEWGPSHPGYEHRKWHYPHLMEEETIFKT